MNLLFLTVVVVFVNVCGSYKILGIFPVASRSHFVMFEALFKGLAEKGHEVDVVSHFPQEKPLERYNDLSVRGSLPTFVNNISISIINHIQSRLQMVDFTMYEAGLVTCDAVLNTGVVKELKRSKKQYDLLVTELFGCDCMLGFGHLLKIPVITMTSSVDLPWGSERIGNPDNPSYIPNYYVPFLSRMSLFERMENTLVLLLLKYRHFLSNKNANIIARNYFGEDLPDLRELSQKTNLILVNSHNSANPARPSVPNLVEVAGIHIPKSKPLPKHLEKILNVTAPYKGVIYLSMGSMVLTETFPIIKLIALCEAFRELPYKILWKATREKMPKELDIPSNIHFEPWLPQFDVLCNPNIKLFISHGGLMGTQEALSCGVPRIGIPLFADQEFNLKTSEAMGLVIVVRYDDITKESILTSARKILENSSYSKNAKIISERFKDRPLSPLDTAIYWVEYVIRHKGAPHLRSVGADLPWYQYYLVDVVAILLGFCAVVVIILYCIIKFLLSYMYNFSKKKQKNE